MQRPRRVRSDVLSRHRFLELVEHHLEANVEGGQRPHTIQTLKLPNWVTVVPITTDNDFLLVRQHRHGIDDVTLEPPSGIVDDGEDPGAAALRELLEETGYAGDSAESLGWVHPNPALQDNRCHLFLARGVREVAEPQQSVDEETEPVRLSPVELRAALVDGRISHALAVVALMRALERMA